MYLLARKPMCKDRKISDKTQIKKEGVGENTRETTDGRGKSSGQQWPDGRNRRGIKREKREVRYHSVQERPFTPIPSTLGPTALHVTPQGLSKPIGEKNLMRASRVSRIVDLEKYGTGS